ncbi:MAG: hypothetical protein PHO08_09325 [Methylococcales bacterium]|nr:hypothetical protein [Methylococcales bacterium]MDD5632863.1 hypothetical protein [Methylococcales bacterium]
MNIIDMRKGPRRTSTTESESERRKNTSEFGSPEWLEHIKNNLLDCPNFDRRNIERRTSDRRETNTTESAHTTKNTVRIFLTPAEKKLIQDLHMIDLK